MVIRLKTQITSVGPDAADLAEGGLVILFVDGAPPELSEVSILHKPASVPTEEAPKVGEPITIGAIGATITTVGETAWKKILSLGHVVINFNDAVSAERPGEICATSLDADALKGALAVGEMITIGA